MSQPVSLPTADAAESEAIEVALLVEKADDVDEAEWQARKDAALRSRHWTMLWVSCGVLLAAMMLEVRPDQRVFLPGLTDFPLPETCGSKKWFGVECPGCGLTRSFVHLAHGRWLASLSVQHVGWTLFLATLAQLPYRIVALSGKNLRPLGERFPKIFGNALIFLLVANWLVNFALPYCACRTDF